MQVSHELSRAALGKLNRNRACWEGTLVGNGDAPIQVVFVGTVPRIGRYLINVVAHFQAAVERCRETSVLEVGIALLDQEACRVEHTLPLILTRHDPAIIAR